MAKKTSTKGPAPRMTKGGKRKTGDARQDSVAEQLAGCDTPKAIANLVTKFGISKAECNHRFENSPNFGQFRMTIGNRLRGLLNRIQKARKTGIELSVEEAAGRWDSKTNKVVGLVKKSSPKKKGVAKARSQAKAETQETPPSTSAGKGQKKARSKKARSKKTPQRSGFRSNPD